MTASFPFPKGRDSCVMTAAERKASSILIVDSDKIIRQNLRSTLMNLGYTNISDTADHATAINRLEQRHFTHLIFEAKRTNMPAGEFLHKALSMDPRMIAIPSSSDPSVDDVFNLLICGARGYLVKPFHEASLDDSITMSTKGEAISDCILHARDRNEALAALVMTSFDKLATVLRQSVEFETARREVPGRTAMLRRAVDIARTFAEGGDIPLLNAIVEFCEDRSNGPASRLGRVRERLHTRAIPAREEVPAS